MNIYRFLHLIKSNRYVKKIILAVLILFFIAFLSLFLFWMDYTGKDEHWETKISFISRLPKLLDIYYLPLMFGKSDLPNYEIKIDQKYLKEINKLKPERVCCNCKPEEIDKYVPAEFIYNKEIFDIEIKLRGDCSNHWVYPKKSWNIKFKDESGFQGKEKIGLIIPIDREYIAENVNHYRAKKLGLVVPESKFVTLKINKKYYGVYMEQEAISDKVLEKNGQPADVNIYKDSSITDRLFLNPGLWEKDNQDRIFEFSNYAELYKLLDLINNASDEDFFAQIPNLVDMDNLYRWEVLSMLSGNYHQDFAHNMVIYFNITSGKFKFIPQDVGLSSAPPIDIIYNPLADRVAKNSEFLYARNRILWEYVENDKNLEDDLGYFDKMYDKIRWSMYRTFREQNSNFYFDKKTNLRRKRYVEIYHQAQDVLKENDQLSTIIDYSQNQISQISNQNIWARVEFVVNSFSGVNVDEIELELKKDNKINGELSLYYDKNKNGILDIDDIKLTDMVQKNKKLITKNFSINFHSERDIPDFIDYNSDDFVAGTGPLYKPIRLKVTSHNLFIVSNFKNDQPLSNYLDKFRVTTKNAITQDKIDDVKIYLDNTTFETFLDINLSLEEFVNKNPNFLIQQENLILPSGDHYFTENIIIPKIAKKMIIQPGATLYFSKNISFYSYSPVEAKGNEFNNISFKRSDIKQKWGSFTVVNQKNNQSHFEFVKIDGGGESYINGVYSSGQISFYHSDVVIKNCYISNSSSDDGLNIKYAYAEVLDNKFYNNSFDGLDLDYANENSLVENNEFSKNENDAIDISGSHILINNNRVLDSGDKCLSIGERSNPDVVNNLFKECETGVAVKDGSQPIISDNTITNNKIGVAVFEKKIIFGGAHPTLSNNIIENNQQQIYIDEKSTVKYDK